MVKTDNLEELVREELNAQKSGNESQQETNQPQEKKEENQGSGNASLPRYKVGNRELDPDQLYEEYRRAQAALTKAFQEKAELEKQLTERQSQKQEEQPASRSSTDEAVLAELRRLGVYTKEDIEKFKESLKEEIKKEATTEAERKVFTRLTLEEALEELEEDFAGQEEEINGIKVRRPKVEREKILNYIIQNPGINLSPKEIAQIVYYDDFVKYEAAKYIPKPAGNLPKTEDVGLGGQPQPPTPRYSFKDGSVEKAVSEMLKK